MAAEDSRPTGGGRASLRRQGGDAVWTVADQGLSAASNLLVSIAAGRAGGAGLLGQFTVAFTAYLLALGFSRSLVSEPLLSLPVGDDRRPDRGAVTSVLAFSLPCGALSATAGLLLGQPQLLVLAAVLPALLVQDLLRFAAFRRRRARRAALLDGLWLATLLAAWPALTSVGSASALVLLWGAGAAVAAAWGLRQALPAHPRAAWWWWSRDARRVGGLLAFDSAVFSLTGQGTVFALAALLGTADLGRLRAAQVLLGPAGTLLTAFNAFALPRLASRAGRIRGKDALALCALSAGASAAAVGVSLAARPLVQAAFFGDEVDVSSGLVAVVGLTMVAVASSAGLVLHLKALRELRTWTLVRCAVAVLGVPAVLGSAVAGGLTGAVWAMLAVAVLGAGGDLLAWRRRTRGDEVSGAPAAAPRSPARPPAAP